MPNGGSDCCGTCWFNRANGGKAGHAAKDPSVMPHCTIRGLDIADPFYTYCANHPHKNPGKVDIPIGPVFTGDSFGNREVWKPAPDTPEIRAAVIDLLARIPEQPGETYPAGLSMEATALLQVGEWREERALPAIDRIIAFDPAPEGGAKGYFARNQKGLILLARRVRARITGERWVEPEPEADDACMFCGASIRVSPPIRGHFVRCGGCGAVHVAGHGTVIAGWTAEDSGTFGEDLPQEFPRAAGTPRIVLHPGERGPELVRRGVDCAEMECQRCGAGLLDPTPGVMRRAMCPGCDHWLETGTEFVRGKVQIRRVELRMPGIDRSRPLLSREPGCLRPPRPETVQGCIGIALGSFAVVMPWVYETSETLRNALVSGMGVCAVGAGATLIRGRRSAAAWLIGIGAVLALGAFVAYAMG